MGNNGQKREDAAKFNGESRPVLVIKATLDKEYGVEWGGDDPKVALAILVNGIVAIFDFAVRQAVQQATKDSAPKSRILTP